VATSHHRLEETWTLRNLPFYLFNFAVFNINNDVSMALNPGHMVNVNVHIFFHFELLLTAAVNILDLSWARFSEKPALSLKTLTKATSFGLSTNPRQASQGIPSAGQGALQPARAT
jgi:hypothetical protein